MSWATLRVTFPALNPAQLHRLLTQYQLASAMGPVSAWEPGAPDGPEAFQSGEPSQRPGQGVSGNGGLRVETPKLQLRKAPEQPPEVGTQEPPTTQHLHPGAYCAAPQVPESVSFLLLGLQTGAQLAPSR
jgi:hypothetical protein